MIKKKYLIFLLVFIVAEFALFSSADGHHAYNWHGFFGKVVDSTLVFGLLIFFLRKPIINLLSQQSVQIKRDIVDRQSNIKETEQRLAELKDRFKNIEQEIEAMKKEAAESGKAEADKIEELGRIEAERIGKMGREEVEVRIESAIRRLKEEISERAIESFKSKIHGDLDKKAHDRIIEENIKICGDIIER